MSDNNDQPPYSMYDWNAEKQAAIVAFEQVREKIIKDGIRISAMINKRIDIEEECLRAVCNLAHELKDYADAQGESVSAKVTRKMRGISKLIDCCNGQRERQPFIPFDSVFRFTECSLNRFESVVVNRGSHAPTPLTSFCEDRGLLLFFRLKQSNYPCRAESQECFCSHHYHTGHQSRHRIQLVQRMQFSPTCANQITLLFSFLLSFATFSVVNIISFNPLFCQ